ncbi:MAG TPA: hypothetical protein VNL77_01735 [Roseiflexaceae bacterium]|nr:hypothetical protein [Roseiflexaceae bacterium]
MRILLSEMAPQMLAQLRYALQREPWVTAVMADRPEPAYDDPGGSYEPLETALAPRGGETSLTGRVGAARADLLVLDWDVAAPLPLGALESLKAAYPHVQVAALSTQPRERPAALAAGVDVFLLTDGTPEAAVAALRANLEPPSR